MYPSTTDVPSALRTGDPQIGLRLRPSPAGGPPTLPQTASRYAVPPVQSVVGQAARSWDPLDDSIVSNIGKWVTSYLSPESVGEWLKDV
jgi:hypothetical protein